VLSAAFLLVFYTSYAQDPKAVSAITISPDVSGLSVGDIVHVPLRVTTATGPNVPISSAVFYIDYDQNVLSPLGPSGYTISYMAIYIYNPYYGGNGNNRLYLSFETIDGGNKNFANVKLLTLDFIFMGGSSTMHLRRSPDVGNLCAFFNNLGSGVPISSYTDNTVSGAAAGTYYDLHSVTTGGPFDWFDASSWQEGKTPTKAANVFITGEEVQIFYNDPAFAEIPRCHDLTIYPAGFLTVNPDYSLSVSGALTVQSGKSNPKNVIVIPKDDPGNEH
jgi:hypothetical protein